MDSKYHYILLYYFNEKMVNFYNHITWLLKLVILILDLRPDIFLRFPSKMLVNVNS